MPAEVARNGTLDEAGLLLLESDDWVSRAWTYQEIVNSKSFRFAAEGGASLSGMQFLSELGGAIERYKRRHSCDSFALRTLRPRLDNSSVRGDAPPIRFASVVLNSVAWKRSRSCSRNSRAPGVTPQAAARAALRPDTTEAAHAVALSPDGSRLAVGYADNVVRVWPVVARQEAFTLRTGKEDVTG